MNTMLNASQEILAAATPQCSPVQPRAYTTSESVEEAALLQRLQTKDHAAFAILVRKNSGRMLAVAQRLLGCEEEAQDAVQEALISAFNSIHKFAGNARIGTWLHRIVVNASLMRLRARKRCPETTAIDDLLPTFEADGHRRGVKPAWTAPSHEILERQEMREMIRRNINQLPEDYRIVLMLRDIEEMDTEETATFLGINAGAVKTRLHRARMALRELLEMELTECST